MTNNKRTMFKNNFTKAFLVSAFSLLLGNALQAQTPKLTQPLAKDTSVTIGKLPNGLTYYIKPNAKPAQKVELRLVVKAGSILENPDQQGLAHFMEHMEFNGLKHYPKNELVDYLQKIGVRFGADLNANTGWDRTYFMLPIPTDKPGNLEKGFQIVGDWAGGALITTDEVNEERHVILEELRMRDLNAQTRMLRKFLPNMLNDSRYAYRMSGGKDSIVADANPNLIREFYHDWYRPDLMAVIVVGDITTSKAEALIKKYFGKLKAPKAERARTYYHVAPYTKKQAMVVTDSETTSYGFTLMYPAHPTKIEKTVGDYRQDLLKNIFTQCVNRKLRDMTQAATPAFAGAQLSLGGNIGGITLGDEGMELDVTPIDNLEQSVNAAIGELLNIAEYGFTTADIQTTTKGYLPAYENAFEERNDRPSASYTDVYADNFMKGDPLLDIGNEYKYVQEILPTITTADINAYAKKVLQAPQNYFTMVTGPVTGKLTLPTKQGLLQMVDAAFKQQAEQGKEATTATTLLSQQPTPGKIVSETKDAALASITYTLSNGIKVTIKPTDFQKDQVLFSGVKYGGTNLYGAADKSNTTFLSSVIGTMGYGQFTPTALSDFLSGKQANVGVGMTAIADEVSGSSSVKDIKTMLELAYLKLTDPRKDTMLLRGWYNKLEARLPLLNADPQNAFKDSLTKFMYSNNPLTPIVIPTQQDMKNIDVDRILNIYKEQFGNAAGFHFFFVGNVNADSLKPLIEKYLASLPVEDIKPTYKDNGLRMVSGDKTFNFYKGSDKKSILLDIYHGDIAYSPELALRANMLGQIMTIELLNIVREEKQWIYSGGVSASVTKLPYGHYSITAQMPCGPENVQNIFTELDREIKGYIENGVSAEDLEKVKKAMIEQYKEEIKNNGTWAAELQQSLFWGSDKNDFLNYEQRVNAVTGEEIKATAGQLLQNNYIKVASFPQK
ncbi:M16 family metallopeptidase [Arachidicoccus soli]|uniref:Insulinase family protein n=1 Tax=Arachidicoccus soli TaxID=2341117 RepID=A0A386HNU3_9BACT|nr:insulinase family protein [Arachidicoccus soli]AYD47433.1 insulinase family protein [Arachidicoccus soli]